MSYLQIDEQTLNDLGIFGRPGKASVFDLYDRTVTQGGSARLAERFKQPLNESVAIRRQASIYRFFSQKEYRFPTDSTTAGSVAYYLENNDVRTQLLPGSGGLGQRLKGMVGADVDEVFVEDGVKASIRLLFAFDAFLRELSADAVHSGFEADHKMLEALLSEPAFREAIGYGGGKNEPKLSFAALGDLDKSLRFTHREKMLSLLDKLYELDVYLSVGRVYRERGFRFADIMGGEGVSFRGLHHPLVENAIPNDLDLLDDRNVLFLTGANMAGKSTLMKSIGIALYLAHMGFPVAVSTMRFRVMDGIYTSINLADNLTAGASHYYAEVLRVKEVARQVRAGKRLFVVFDELFRGTNVKDAYDATIAITRAFARKKDSRFILSTHIMEAGEVLMEEPLGISYRFLPTEMNGNTPVYPRVLRDGITADRQGMVIIENEGILTMLDQGLAKQKVI